MQLNQKSIQKIREKLLSNFSYFTEMLLDPGWYDEEFHGELCHFMQHSGLEKLIVLPRSHLKTTIAAVMYCLWRATKNPGIRILIASNTTANAQKTLQTIRGIVENNQLYQLFFPEVIPNFNKVRWSNTCACLNRPVEHPEGTFEAAGVGSNVIRRHFNIIIEDDSVSPKKDEYTGGEVMPSRNDIEKAVGFHKLTLPLQVGEEDDERIVIGTRWASYDLINHVQQNEDFAEFNRKCRKEDGTPMYAKKFNEKRLGKYRKSLGLFMFSMLYENTPLAKEFMAFNPDWFRYYEEHELPEDGYGIVTLDPADPPTGKRNQDYSGLLSAKHCKSGMYLRRYKRERWSDGQMIKEGLDMVVKDGARKLRIETNRYAHLEAGFKQEAAKRGIYITIETVKAKTISKEARIKNRLSPLYENGVIWHKRNMAELEQELTTFPYGSHDDLIDAEAWQIERYMPTEFEKKAETNSLPKMPKRMSYTLEEIRASMHKGGRHPYPFQVQMS